jgi:malate dehydrogenase (oxaloacetate-decarboxylating)
MLTPHVSPGYSVSLELEIRNEPGMFARIASAIAGANGDLGAIDIIDVRAGTLVRRVTINARDSGHASSIGTLVGAIEGVSVLGCHDRTFELHRGGKIGVRSKIPVRTRDELSMAYTPGVARVCEAIAREPDRVYDLTIKRHTVAIVTDGSAVLGLGSIGPEAALPVMEGKAILFGEFGGVDAFPLCLATTDAAEIVRTCRYVAPAFGGINLEDIAAPRCFEIENALERELEIPVFHDDQHGTAIVVLAALYNALKIVGKEFAGLKAVVLGLGAAGVACCKMLLRAGVRNVVGCDRQGVLYRGRRGHMNDAKRELAENTNPEGIRGGLEEAVRGADLFLGLSGPGLFRPELARDRAV